ncbi:cobalt transporter CbiM, partial [bacterium]|nr:cobalt transporter CbiM [bacterium]
YDRIPQVAVLSAVFFVAALIHVPVPPTSAHLILNGLAGLILGWAVFPALLVGLLLQCVLFGFGGLLVLGVNTMIMALPGVVCHMLFARSIRRGGVRTALWLGFAAGALAVLLAGVLAAGALLASGKALETVAHGVFLVHAPVLVVEGLVTSQAVVFLRKVRPEVFGPSEDVSHVHA